MAYVPMVCTRCGGTLNVDDSLTDGSTPRCPKCLSPFESPTLADPDQTAAPVCDDATLAGTSAGEDTGSYSPSDLFGGRYRIEKDDLGGQRVLGEGGMGRVLLAYDVRMKRRVALKIPRQSDPRAWHRLTREAEAAARFHHPNSCPVFEVSEDPPFLAMAFVEGRTLSQKLEAEGTIPQREAASLVRTIARVLSVAHRARIIHRDLKPSNVMITPDGVPILMDFGLAKTLDSEGPSLTHEALGTPAYMSPEQVNNDRAIGPATDIYSLGVLLYRLLVGRLPFDAGGFGLLFQKILNEEASAPSTCLAGIDPRLDAICLKAMSKDPSHRFAGMDELSEALTDYLDDRSKAPVAFAQPKPVEAKPKKSGRTATRLRPVAHDSFASDLKQGVSFFFRAIRNFLLFVALPIALFAAFIYFSVRPDRAKPRPPVPPIPKVPSSPPDAPAPGPPPGPKVRP